MCGELRRQEDSGGYVEPEEGARRGVVSAHARRADESLIVVSSGHGDHAEEG